MNKAVRRGPTSVRRPRHNPGLRLGVHGADSIEAFGSGFGVGGAA